MAALQSGYPHLQRRARTGRPCYRQTACHSAAAGTTDREDPLRLGVQIQHLSATQRCGIQRRSAQHAHFLFRCQQHFQPRMGNGIVVQNCQRDGGSNAVISAQRRAYSMDEISFDGKIQAFLLHILGTVRCFLAHHVQMSLQNHRLRIFVTDAGSFDDDYIMHRILMDFQSSRLCKIHAPVADSLGITGTVRNGTEFFKIMKDAFRLQMLQYSHEIAPFSR